jgi:hypothetical protein
MRAGFGNPVRLIRHCLHLKDNPQRRRLDAHKHQNEEQQLTFSRSPRSSGFRTPITLFVLLVVVFSITSVAAAAPPTRQANPLPTDPFIFTDTLGNNPCGFPVLLEITTNKEVLTTYTRTGGVTTIHTTGALKVLLTNTVTDQTIARNISGPILSTVNSDGSVTQLGLGPALWVFDPGVAPGLPRLVLTSGRTESILGPGTAFRFLSVQGHYEDICLTLA